MRHRYIIICLFFFIVVITGGCSLINPTPTVSPKPIRLVRFDLAMDSLVRYDTLSLNSYAPFLPLYYSFVLKTEEQTTERLKGFAQDSATRTIQLRINEYLSDLQPEQSEIAQALGYFNAYYPNQALPKTIYAHISPFGVPVLTTPEYVAIALDRYLGGNFEMYQGIFEPFQIQRMNREQIPVDLVLAWLYRTFPEKQENGTLLDRMLYQGAIYLTLEKLFPERKKEDLLLYSSEQMKWLKKNEASVWTRIVEQGHLYSTNAFLQSKYLNPAPFTAPIDPQSPPQIGIWTGIQIMEKQLKQKDAVPLDSILINGFDSYQLLSKSRYNGK